MANQDSRQNEEGHSFPVRTKRKVNMDWESFILLTVGMIEEDDEGKAF